MDLCLAQVTPYLLIHLQVANNLLLPMLVTLPLTHSPGVGFYVLRCGGGKGPCTGH